MVAALADDDAGGAAGRIEAATGTTLVERFQVEERVLDAANAFTRPALPFAQTANAAYRRVIFQRVGLFDPSLVSGGDLDLSWRMQRAGWGLAYAPGAVVRHRHRRTFRALVRLYAKNGHGAALLGDRYPSYAPYQSLRVPLCRLKEMTGDLGRFALGLPARARAARCVRGVAAVLQAGSPPRRPARLATLAHRRTVRHGRARLPLGAARRGPGSGMIGVQQNTPGVRPERQRIGHRIPVDASERLAERHPPDGGARIHDHARALEVAREDAAGRRHGSARAKAAPGSRQ